MNEPNTHEVNNQENQPKDIVDMLIDELLLEASLHEWQDWLNQQASIRVLNENNEEPISSVKKDVHRFQVLYSVVVSINVKERTQEPG